MTPRSEPETDTRLDASITASGGESEGTALVVGSYGFQRSLTRWRWLLDPLPLELTSQVETDQPLLSCADLKSTGHNHATSPGIPRPPGTTRRTGARRCASTPTAASRRRARAGRARRAGVRRGTGSFGTSV